MKYILRTVKYLIKLAVLLALIFFLMQLSGTSSIESDGGGVIGFFKTFWATSNGKLFIAAILIWSAIYPAVEYKKINLSYDPAERKNAIIRAMQVGNMSLAADDGSRMVFAGSPLRRVWWLGEDAVTITRNTDGGIDIEGPRRFVMEARHRIPNYVEAEKENEQI